MTRIQSMVCALFVCGAVLATVDAAVSATPPAIREIRPAKNVLIFGNSFSFYNNGMHTFLRNIARERAGKDERLIFRIITVSGGYLEDAGASFDSAIKRQYKWDTVVFQGNSDEPVNPKKKAGFEKYARELAAKAKANNLQSMFFATWGYPERPEMTGELMEAYTRVANETGSMVSPVGLAFAASLKQKPEIVLIGPDNRHPTVAGSYLAACTLYASMMKASPEGVKYDADLGPATAAFLQKVAWQTARSFYGW